MILSACMLPTDGFVLYFSSALNGYDAYMYVRVHKRIVNCDTLTAQLAASSKNICTLLCLLCAYPLAQPIPEA